MTVQVKSDGCCIIVIHLYSAELILFNLPHQTPLKNHSISMVLFKEYN